MPFRYYFLGGLLPLCDVLGDGTPIETGLLSALSDFTAIGARVAEVVVPGHVFGMVLSSLGQAIAPTKRWRGRHPFPITAAAASGAQGIDGGKQFIAVTRVWRRGSDRLRRRA